MFFRIHLRYNVVMQHFTRTPSLWIPVLIWAGLIFALSAVAGLQSGFPTGVDLLLRKLAHAAEFAILAALLVRALSNDGTRLGKNVLWLSFLLSVVYAMSDEWHQGFVADRVPSLLDVGIDCLGALAGTDLMRHWYLRKQKQPG